MPAQLPADVDIVRMDGLYPGHDGHVVEAIRRLEPAALALEEIGAQPAEVGQRSGVTDGGGHQSCPPGGRYKNTPEWNTLGAQTTLTTGQGRGGGSTR